MNQYEEVKNIIGKIETLCLENMTRKELFENLLTQISEHVVKVRGLKEEGELAHMDEEIIDIGLLYEGLRYLRQLDDSQVVKGAEYTLSKLKRFYGVRE